MKISVEIKSWLTGRILFKAEVSADLTTAQQLGEAVKLACKASANLDGANLYGANLYEANLYEANLARANLYGANLTQASLDGANLYGAILYEANLTRASLDGANLTRANLTRANLYGANLTRANLPPVEAARVSIVPEVGAYTAWKKCRDGVVVKLLIPEEAKRSNSTGRKCRAEFAHVLKVIGAEKGISIHDGSTEYRVGVTVRCDVWGDNRWEECAGGIHHFITRIEAEHYD